MWYSYRHLLDQKPTSKVVYFIKYSVVDEKRELPFQGRSYIHEMYRISVCKTFNVLFFVFFQQKIENCVLVFVNLTVITVQVSLCKYFSDYSYDKYSYRDHQD